MNGLQMRGSPPLTWQFVIGRLPKPISYYSWVNSFLMRQVFAFFCGGSSRKLHCFADYSRSARLLVVKAKPASCLKYSGDLHT